MKKTIIILMGFLFSYSVQSFSQKIYNIGSYQIKYNKGAKLDWGQAYDLANKYDEYNTTDWRLPSIDELKEIYFFRQSIGIAGGTFWSSSLKPPLRMGLIYCIDFSKGDEDLSNDGKNFYMLIKHQR